MSMWLTKKVLTNSSSGQLKAALIFIPPPAHLRSCPHDLAASPAVRTLTAILEWFDGYMQFVVSLERQIYYLEPFELQ